MKIGMIGAGEVALAIARYALAEGHQVVLSASRGPEALSDVLDDLGMGASAASVGDAASAEVVVLAVPWTKVGDALAGLPAWEGRILIDATNPFLENGPKPVMADLGGRGASELVAELVPGAAVVKAFNSIVMTKFGAGPAHNDARRVLFVSGDDADAKGKVSDLIGSFGFAVIDLGSLKEGGRMQQAGGPLAGKDLLLAR